MYSADFENEVKDLKQEIENSEIPVLVDCFATWCGPCKMLSPIIEKIKEKYEGSLKVIKVDVDECRDFAAENEIMSIPTLLFYSKGKLIERQTGFKPESEICKIIDKELLPTSEEIKNEIKNFKGAVLLDFFTTWCKYCKKLEPVIEKVKEKYGDDLKVIKVDAEKYKDLSDEYGVDIYPTMKFFYDGQLVKTLEGFSEEDVICSLIDTDLLSKKK